MLGRATAAALLFDADRHGETHGTDPDPATAPGGRAEARAWLDAERAQWLAALRRAAETGRHRQVTDAAQAMHWFSDLTKHWEEWAELFGLGVTSVRALGSRRDEAVHLNYPAWARNLCVHDHPGALAVADEAPAVARALGDGLQTCWALGYGAAALHRIGRAEESLVRFREAAARLRAESSGQARLAELTVLNSSSRAVFREHPAVDVRIDGCENHAAGDRLDRPHAARGHRGRGRRRRRRTTGIRNLGPCPSRRRRAGGLQQQSAAGADGMNESDRAVAFVLLAVACLMRHGPIGAAGAAERLSCGCPAAGQI
ncbi:hypothetical protein ACIQU4_18785 [Streptomyces sp. NPDC090741]|uniref:hypothetical protein n=1 Tax=Streptomyces sp. NPDC090741 TaxID=3365967 RepID=UPI00382D8A25